MTHPAHGASIVRSLIARFGREDIMVIASAAGPEEEDGGHDLKDVEWGYGGEHATVVARLGLSSFVFVF
eukprot:CAMPEP_0198263412 /NCGR_PEP_ID=MMETSP1447-20131203/11738_1 /TAXON_ID=420782 /ORGANISM="Chaetoceros dichaeta, Strain CCMP1751" /LENGTH=68 /DNA_ID=CAMNT_0043951975 /DNA_START=266 /DNA_END=472 /DNA_ORIENTATION=-